MSDTHLTVEIYLSHLSLSQLTEIMQLMNAYFSATRRQLGKDDCIYMETNPKLRPSLLELPSHPVWREDSRAHTHTWTPTDAHMQMQSWPNASLWGAFAQRTNSDETERSRCCGNGGVEGVQGATNRRAGSGTHLLHRQPNPERTRALKRPLLPGSPPNITESIIAWLQSAKNYFLKQYLLPCFFIFKHP